MIALDTNLLIYAHRSGNIPGGFLEDCDGIVGKTAARRRSTGKRLVDSPHHGLYDERVFTLRRCVHDDRSDS